MSAAEKRLPTNQSRSPRAALIRCGKPPACRGTEQGFTYVAVATGAYIQQTDSLPLSEPAPDVIRGGKARVGVQRMMLW